MESEEARGEAPEKARSIGYATVAKRKQTKRPPHRHTPTKRGKPKLGL